jgi:hypothetical protein
MIAEILHKLAETNQEKEYKFYPRPSLAGPERCIRSMVYWGLNSPREPFPGRTQHVFDDGIWHEELTADWLRKSTFRLHSEQMKVNSRKPMTWGHIDGIVTDLLNVDRHYEHKGLNHFTFEKYWKGDEYPEDYFTQCAIYNEAIQKELLPDLRESILLIKNKNSAAYMEYILSLDIKTDSMIIVNKTHSTGETIRLNILRENIVTSACDKFYKVLDYVKRKTLPKRQYDIDHWRCEYCSYGKVCWAGYEKEFKELKTDTMLPNEVEDAVRYYRELGAQKKDIEAEYKKLGKTIKDTMKEADAREGKAGNYICRMALVKRSNVDHNLIPQKLIEAATQYSHYERLYIRNLTKEKNNG